MKANTMSYHHSDFFFKKGFKNQNFKMTIIAEEVELLEK